jgi:hypothetical protein
MKGRTMTAPMDPNREARLRNAVARLINAGLRDKAVTDDMFPVDPDDLFVWEVIQTIRNSAFKDAQAAMDALKHHG